MSRDVDGAAVSGDEAFRVVVDPITGDEWDLCERPDCDLEIVRPGKVQCRCEDEDACDIFKESQEERKEPYGSRGLRLRDFL